MRDRRGFKYALEPLRTLCELDLTRVRADLALASSQVQTHRQAVEGLHAQLEMQCAQAREAGAVMSIELRRMQHAHVHFVSQTLQRAKADLHVVEQEHDRVVQASIRLTRFRDGVEKHRTERLAEFDRDVLARELRDADDQWLASRTRTVQ